MARSEEFKFRFKFSGCWRAGSRCVDGEPDQLHELHDGVAPHSVWVMIDPMTWWAGSTQVSSQEMRQMGDYW